MFENIIQKIKKANHVGIFTHINPDGDAMGSAFSLKAVLEDMGKTAEVFYSGAVEPCLLELVVGASESAETVDECDLLIALDCAAADRLGVWSDAFLCHKNTAAIDHHITHIEFAGDTVVGDISSTCELMYALYREMGIEISLSAATNLYIGMATDTGNFKFSSVTGDTHRAVAELIDAGVDFPEISKKLFGADMFDEIWGYTPQFPVKPAPDSLLAMMERLGVTKDETVYIGDSDVDVRLGKAAQVFTVGVSWGLRGEEELIKEGADAIAETPEELISILLEK